MGTMITGPAAIPAEWTELLRRSAVPRTGLHVTSCLGCPRRDALLREGAEPDLSRLEARLSGNIVHSALSSVNPERAEIAVYGKLFGHDVVGSIDRIEDGPEHYLTCDYKTSEDDKVARQPDAPYAEQVWQQEAYRFLTFRPTDGWRIYFRRQGKWSRYEHIGPAWTEDELAEFRPHGGAFTTAEIAGQCVSGEPAARLPLVGATQRIGTSTACSYCECEKACNDIGSEVEL